LVRFGDQLQVSAEMVDARQGTHMWGEQYNRHASDLLQVQGEISREIANKLRLHLSSGERQQLASRETANPLAYELLLKGRFYRGKGGTENGKKAIEYLNRTIAVDPNYALAHAELSRLYWGMIGDSILDPKEFMPKAEGAARRALELDQNLAEAHLAQAQLKLSAWDWATAEQQYKRAVELNPNLGEAHRWYSFYLSLMGRHDQAVAEIKRSRELDPLSPGVNTNVGYRFYFARRYDEAIEALTKVLELDQNYPPAHAFLGFAYAAKGDYPKAIDAYEQAIRLGDDSSSTRIYLGAAYAKAGEREKAQAILNELRRSTGYVSPGELAALYAALGEQEQAFASLERAYAAHDLQLQYLGVDPMLDPLRSDPRFQDLVRRIGLPLQAWKKSQ
jgi:tetratricopeptide (TPR) repeat protein